MYSYVQLMFANRAAYETLNDSEQFRHTYYLPAPEHSWEYSMNKIKRKIKEVKRQGETFIFDIIIRPNSEYAMMCITVPETYEYKIYVTHTLDLHVLCCWKYLLQYGH